MTGSSKSNPEYRLTPSMRDTIEFCYQNSRDEYSQVVVEIYVEGTHDVEFYRSWVDDSGLDFNLKNLSVVVNEINDAENDKVLVSPEGASGNCGRIREYARLNEEHTRKIWISDRDLLKDDDVKEYSRDNLFFTDFPAIESYGFLESVLDGFNGDRYGGNLESLKNHNHIDFLKAYLKGVYFYRCTLQKRGGSKGMNSKTRQLHHKLKEYVESSSGDLSIGGLLESLGNLVAGDVVAVIKSRDDDTGDFRAYVYGHDVGSALKGIIASDEKRLSSRYPVNSKNHIEQYIRDKYIREGLYNNDTLFESLRMRIEYVYHSAMK